MARSLPINFRIHIPEPVEVKMVSQTIAQRNAISNLERFKGLFTYVVEDDTFYYLSGGTGNEHWKPIASSQVQAVEIFDEFTDQPQTVVSGFGLKRYLEQNYVTRQELQDVIANIQQELPEHLRNLTPEQIAIWNNIEGDKNVVHIQSTASDVWVIQHNIGKRPSIHSYTTEGNRVFGREFEANDNVYVIGFSRPITGYATIN